MKKFTLTVLITLFTICPAFGQIADKLIELHRTKILVKNAIIALGGDLSGKKFYEYPDVLSGLYDAEPGLNVTIQPGQTPLQNLQYISQIKSALISAVNGGGVNANGSSLAGIASRVAEIQLTGNVTFTVQRNGQPLNGVVVTIDGDDYTTNVSGSVTVPELTPGDHAFQVASSGYVTGMGDLNVLSGDSSYVLEMIADYVTGDTGPSGGVIAHVNPNYPSQGWKYLEVIHHNYDPAAFRWTNLTSTELGGTSTAVGSGPDNTLLIVNQAGFSSGAASICASRTVGPYDDWFLPSRDELEYLYSLKTAGLATFTSASSYWSSSEVSATNAYRKSFGTGTVSSSAKSTSYGARAVRRFTGVEFARIVYLGNGNTGGTVASATPFYPKGTVVTIASAGGLVHSADSFIGWATRSDGGGDQYASATSIILSDNLVLYARWDTETIVFLPDTQTYTKWKQSAMTAQIDWIVAEADDMNLKFVTHVGDIIQEYDVPAQWEYAAGQMTKLPAAGINYSLCPGNHDYETGTRNNSVYNSYFPIASFTGMSTYGGAYEESYSDNTYHLFSLRGRDVILFNIEFGPRNGVLDWVNGLLAAHSSRTAIIVTHGYLGITGERLGSSDSHSPTFGYGLGEDANNGVDIWDKVVENNSNVRFVICGHDGSQTIGAKYKIDTRQDGSKCYQILNNWQYDSTYTGYLGVLAFNSTEVAYSTYSPYRLEYCTASESMGLFTW